MKCFAKTKKILTAREEVSANCQSSNEIVMNSSWEAQRNMYLYTSELRAYSFGKNGDVNIYFFPTSVEVA